MKSISISDFKARTREHLDNLKKDRNSIILIGPKQRKFVVMSANHYSSMMETLHLLSTTANAIRLMKSIDEHKNSTKDSQTNKKRTRKSFSANSLNAAILTLNNRDSGFFTTSLNNPPEPSKHLIDKLGSNKSEHNSD